MKFTEHFGLDIGSTEVKAVWLGPNGSGFKLLSLGIAALPIEGIGDLGSETSQTHLAEVVKKLVNDCGIKSKNVACALPESQVVTRVIETPALAENELRNAIKWEAEQYVPIPMDEVTVDYQILSAPKNKPEEKMEVLLVAAPNNLINQYLNVIKLAGLTAVGLETEILAISRALVTSDPYSPTSLIINLGAATTDLSVISQGGVAFVRSISTGGMAITRSISTELGLELRQAEECKRTYGMDSTKLEGRVFNVIKLVLDLIVTETKRGLLYYQSKNPDDVVKRVVLAGGMAQMPGIVEYLANALTLEVQVGNPFANVLKTEQQNKDLAGNVAAYAGACGLAMKEGD